MGNSGQYRGCILFLTFFLTFFLKSVYILCFVRRFGCASYKDEVY